MEKQYTNQEKNQFELRSWRLAAYLAVGIASIIGAGMININRIEKAKENKLEQIAMKQNVVKVQEVNDYVDELNRQLPDYQAFEISEKGIELIKEFEGFESKSYNDVNQMAIGYGHKIQLGENLDNITEKEAEDRLYKDVKDPERIIQENVKVSLNQNQYDALCSFIYNIKRSKFEDSTLLRKLNNKDYEGAGEEFKKWVHTYDKEGNKKVLKGLVKRRQVEYELFNSNQLL